MYLLTNDITMYEVIERTWLSPIYVAIGSRGLLRIELGGSEHDFISKMKNITKSLVRRENEAMRTAMDQIRSYLNGARRIIDLPMDWSILSPFQLTVLQSTCQIPYGSVTTYGAIARQVGNPRAARAVGQALSHNPLPLAIPCHRVVAADGSLRGYGGIGGIKTKQALLELEHYSPS